MSVNDILCKTVSQISVSDILLENTWYIIPRFFCRILEHRKAFFVFTTFETVGMDRATGFCCSGDVTSGTGTHVLGIPVPAEMGGSTGKKSFDIGQVLTENAGSKVVLLQYCYSYSYRSLS